MQYTVDQVYQRLIQKTLDIYDIFKGFFGEDYVDLQIPSEVVKANIKNYLLKLEVKAVSDTEYEITDATMKNIIHHFSESKGVIYVWWPKVTVTNENDKSIVIQDLYAKITVQMDGRIPYENIGFLLNRATYTQEQFLSNYMFSHIRAIPKYNYKDFQSPCLGTGPIRETIATLKNEGDEVTWMLYCEELAMYVTVESLKGGPWKRLESVGSASKLTDYSGYDFGRYNADRFLRVYSLEQLKCFIKFYLEHGHLSLGFRSGEFVCSMPYYDYIIDVSNSFIDYYNEYLKATEESKNRCFLHRILYNAVVINGKFYKHDTNENISILNFERECGKHVLTFKGKEVKLNIIKERQSEATLTTVVDHYLAMYILHQILRTINYRYRNGYNIIDKEVTPACQGVVYI